jgi:hypothetical protein
LNAAEDMMASKSMTTETPNADMDYAQHDATWSGFVNLVKWSIFIIAFLLLSLYCFIQAGQFWAGLLLLVIGFATPVVMAFVRSMR